MSQIDSRNADKAQPLRGGGTNGEPIKPSENGFNDHVKNFSQFLGGVYFGNPLTRRRADSRIYSDTNISDNDAHKYTFFLLNLTCQTLRLTFHNFSEKKCKVSYYF